MTQPKTILGLPVDIRDDMPDDEIWFTNERGEIVGKLKGIAADVAQRMSPDEEPKTDK